MVDLGRELRVRYDFIASTGRTATTFIASRLNRIGGVAACHEGYRGSDKGEEPLLPLINLENALVFGKPDTADDIVAEKRGANAVRRAARIAQCDHIVDVAYYNPTLAQGLLRAHGQSKMIGVIRECASFVRSATTLEGEDLMPVGWPCAAKTLSDREKFIAMGRIRPNRKSEIHAEWKEWPAVRRNIWLWEATNLLLTRAKAQYPDRVSLVRFETLSTAPEKFWTHICDFLEMPALSSAPSSKPSKFTNSKIGGYQIGTPDAWTVAEQAAAQESQDLMQKRAIYDC